MNFFHNYKWIKILVLVSIMVALIATFFRFFNADELEAIHTTYKIWQGEKIYTDFFQHHHPLLYYSFQPLFWIFGESLYILFAARFIIFIFYLGIIYISFKLTRLIFNKEVAWLSLLLLTTTVIFVDKVIEIRPDVLQSFFGLFAIYYYFKFFHSKLTKHIIYSAALLAISLLFLQKALFLIFIFLILLIYDLINKKMSKTNFAAFSIAFFLTLAPFVAYLVFEKAWTEYILFCWVINILFIYEFPFYTWIVYSSVTNTVLVVFYIIGLFKLHLNEKYIKFGIFSFGLLVSAVLTRLPFRQYFMLAIPLVSAIAASSLIQIKNKNKYLYSFICLIAFSIGLMSFSINLYYHRNNDQLKLFSYVHSLLESGDYVYSSDEHISLFHRDIDYFWFSTSQVGALGTYQTISDYNYDLQSLIENKKPKIITNYRLDETSLVIKNNYTKSPIYNNLYLRIE